MGVLNGITALQDEAVYCREKGLTIGLCHGCFDIVHPGHIYHLQRASTMVDRLFVSVTADQYVNKGADRPVFPDRKRAEFLASIRYCDHVIVNHTATAEFMIKTLRPNLYFKGADYSDGSDARLQAERALVESAGGRMVLTDDKIFDSTSRIAKLVMSTNRSMSKLLLIDLDGTMIDTPHFEAWRNAAHELSGKQLTQQEYIDHIAGRPRMEGASRLLALTTDDVGGAKAGSFSADELAEYKQKEFLRLSPGTELFDDALRLLERIEESAQPVMFYTASLNAPQLFEAALNRSNVRRKAKVSITRQAPHQTRDELVQQLIGDHDPQDVHLIDDSPYVTDLACGLGLHAWQIRRHHLEPKAAHPRASILSSLDEFTLANNPQGRNDHE